MDNCGGVLLPEQVRGGRELNSDGGPVLRGVVDCGWRGAGGEGMGSGEGEGEGEGKGKGGGEQVSS
jgi:hypothetical protein